MSGTWNELKQVKIKRLSLRKKLALRKRNRDIIAGTSTGKIDIDNYISPKSNGVSLDSSDLLEKDSRLERFVQDHVMDPKNQCTDSLQLMSELERAGFLGVDATSLHSVLLKLAVQGLISVHETSVSGCSVLQLEVCTADDQLNSAAPADNTAAAAGERDGYTADKQKTDDVLDLLELPSAREKQNKLVGDEIVQLLSRPTVKERRTAEFFRSQGGAHVHEYCRYGTRQECHRNRDSDSVCEKVHFIKIVQPHTDESLGDCSFLNTCFHITTCRYVHYEVDSSDIDPPAAPATKEPASSTVFSVTTLAQPVVETVRLDGASIATSDHRTTLYPPQWIQCDLRVFDMSVIGECAVIMADPPWDIHMELPYGTLSDDEMRNLSIPSLQKSGLFFLWVTGRAMELGRECLQLWGYERVDELIWVKTNQLQRIIRTGRTGHWLNHGKEHCLVGMKGEPAVLNRGLDSDVLVAEVRATSHKPDEIYGIIERLSPGTRKLELFGRPHNAQPNWITLGNQLDGVNLCDPEILQRFHRVYPGGDAMRPASSC